MAIHRPFDFDTIGEDGLSVNFTAMLDDQARHVAWSIHEAMARQARTVQPTAEAQDAWWPRSGAPR